ncbi:MAG: pilus assembly protein PilM [Clostridiales bacterium]|nr:pilus assembly protein PilM [Clostridiales bacterium]
MLGDKYIAIDMGSYSTKVILATKKGKKISVLNSITYKTPKGTVSDGGIIDSTKVKEELEFQLKKNKIRCKNVLFTIGSSATIIRNVILPATAKKEMQSMIRYELEKHVPIRLDEYIVEYEIVNKFKDNDVDKIEALAVLLPKNIIDAYWKLAIEMKLKPIGLTTHYNAIKSLFRGNLLASNKEASDASEIVYSSNELLNSCISVNNAPEKSTIALVEIGHEHVICNIIENGKFKAYRMISAGGRNVAVTIANALNISVEEVEKRKLYVKRTQNKESINTTEEKVIEEATKNSMGNLIDQVQRFFTFQERSRAIEGIDRILIYGGCAYFDGIVDEFKRVTEIHTEILSFSKNVRFTLQDINKDQNLFHNTIGIVNNTGR